MQFDVGQRLKAIRVAMGQSQRGLSLELGLSATAWKTYEDGKSLPGFEVLEALSRRGVDLNWLMSGKGDIWVGVTMPSGPHRKETLREQRLMDSMGLARLALAGSRGRLREMMRILDLLVIEHPEPLPVRTLVLKTGFSEEVVAAELLHLSEIGLVTRISTENVVDDSLAFYRAATDSIMEIAKHFGDKEQSLFDAITALRIDIVPAVLEKPNRGRVVLGHAYVPIGQGQSLINNIIRDIQAKSSAVEAESHAYEDVIVVFGGAICPSDTSDKQ